MKPYVEALVAGLPQKCKLPFYQYGSKGNDAFYPSSSLTHVLSPSLPPSLSSPAGVLGFYLAQLAPVIQYKDLRTDVFQAFKELGNAVIFSLLLEKALGQQEVVDILQAAPFQNLYPKPYVKGNVILELCFNQKNCIT